MPMLTIYVSPETMERLEHYSKESERTVIDLAESAVDDAASQIRMPKKDTPDARPR